MKTALLVLLLAVPLAAQPGADAVLDGRVVNALTGEAVTSARVRIRPVGGGIRVTAVSDAAGSFHFEGLAPGRYGIQVEHADYLRGLGRGRSTAFQATIDMAAGEKRRNFIVGVKPNGGVEGLVNAESGEPIDRCQVELLQFEYREGKPHRAVQGSSATDGRGRFRIADVAPGTYGIRTRCVANPVPFRPLLPEGTTVSGPTLGFASELSPGLVTVDSGSTTRDIEIQVRDSILYPVTGTVAMPPEARSAGSVQIALFPEGGDEEAGQAAIATPANPTFHIAAALPGRYWLVAVATVGDAMYTARQAVTVSEDTPPVDVTLSTGIDVSGSVEIRSAGGGSSVRRLTGALVSSDSLLFGVRKVVSNDDGDFVIHGVPAGVWLPRLSASAPNLYLQSIVSGDRELTSPELAVVDAAPLRIVFSDGAGSIDGVVRESNDVRRPPQWTIVLEPLFTPSFLAPEQLQTTTGADGRFRIDGLAPNRYRLYVLPGLDPEVALDPELLRALEAYSEIVTVAPGTPTTVTGKAAPDAAVSAALGDR